MSTVCVRVCAYLCAHMHTRQLTVSSPPPRETADSYDFLYGSMESPLMEFREHIEVLRPFMCDYWSLERCFSLSSEMRKHQRVCLLGVLFFSSDLIRLRCNVFLICLINCLTKQLCCRMPYVTLLTRLVITSDVHRLMY